MGVPKGWEQVVDYYKNIDDTTRWIPWSQPFVNPPIDTSYIKTEGTFGTSTFHLFHEIYTSLWHDVPIYASQDKFVNFVTEIPMFYTAKMELSKELPNNPIIQDTNDDHTPRFYTYGVTFFNYGFLPQTWEDPSTINPNSNTGGDNDPLDVIEVGSTPLTMGSITPCHVLGSLTLIDQGETDYKILCLNQNDPDAHRIHSLDDLNTFKPGYIELLVHWLKRYKTTDGKPENTLVSDMPAGVDEAFDIINETHQRWNDLCHKNLNRNLKYSIYGGTSSTVQEHNSPHLEDTGFFLDTPNCRKRV